MKTQKALKTIRFCLPVVMVTMWDGASLTAQEKPETLLLWQNVEIAQRDPDPDTLRPAEIPFLFNSKSERKALRLSFFGTLVPVFTGLAVDGLFHIDNDNQLKKLLIGGGIVLGPSLGNFYGGRADRGILGIGVRFAIIEWTTVAAENEAEEAGFVNFAPFIYVIGSAFLLMAIIYDLSTIERAVRKHNRSLQEKALTITPTYFAQHGAPGLKIQLNF